MPEWRRLGRFGKAVVLFLIVIGATSLGLYLVGVYPTKITGAVTIVGVFGALVIAILALPEKRR